MTGCFLTLKDCKMVKDINIGIVADWLVAYAGAERVIKEFIDLYPSSELYSVVDFLSEEARKNFQNKNAQTTFYPENSLHRKLNIKNIYHLCPWL